MKAKARFFSLIVFIFLLQTVLVSTATAATRIMSLGDSITKGTCCSLPEEELVGYREKLYSDLIDQGYDIDFVGSQDHGFFADPWHEGHGGWGADEIRDEVYTWLVQYPADIVLLHIGANDITGGQSAADVRDEINEILNEIDEYEDVYSAEVMVILARIINRQDPTTQESLRTTELNGLLQTLVDNRSFSGDKICDVDQESALSYPGDMDDHVHPNMTGYNKMANVWRSELEKILPAADAGSNQSVDEGVTVTLDGSNSNEPGFNPISSYFWEQTGGKLVTISDPAVVQPTFTAPDVGSRGNTLSFRLTVAYSNGDLSSDNTGVKVNDSSSSSNDNGCFIGTAANGLLVP